MKKQSLVKICAVSTILISLVACQKKQQVIKEQSNDSVSFSNNYDAVGRTVPGANASHYSDGWCRNPINNCKILPEIVIISNPQHRTLGDAIDNGSSSDVAAAFNSSDFDDINHELVPEMVTDLQSGNYYLAISNEDDGKICYIAGLTYPVTEANMEFAFQIKK